MSLLFDLTYQVLVLHLDTSKKKLSLLGKQAQSLSEVSIISFERLDEMEELDEESDEGSESEFNSTIFFLSYPFLLIRDF